jgi:hypothetical protein
VTYIGQQPSSTFDSGIQDRFTGLTTNTVTLTHDISAETDILVVWNNIVQDSGTYSVGGTGNKTLTLGGTLVSADVVTVYYLNKVMQSVNPTAGSVTTTTINDTAVTGAKLNTDVISAQTALSSEPADTDEFLVSDNGVIKRIDYSLIKAGSNTPLWKVWRSGSQSMGTGADTKIPFNTWSLDDDSILNTSNNRVVPGVAGKYFIIAQMRMDTSTDFNMLYLDIRISGSNKSNAQVEHDQTGSVTISLIDNLSATDYIECFGMQNSGGDLNMMGGVQNTWMQGFKLV